MKDTYYDEIKNQLISCEVNKKVKEYSTNKYTLDTYYRVGELLAKAGKHYGEIIKNYSIKLTEDLGKGYTVSELKRRRQFYYMIENGAT